jgi:hypothetical protein
MRIAPCSGSATYCASTPSSWPPSEFFEASAGMRPLDHVWKKVLATRSPTLNCVTPGPTAATSPAPSHNGITGKRV